MPRPPAMVSVLVGWVLTGRFVNVQEALLTSVCVLLVASVAFADAPSSLKGGNWSLGFNADADEAVAVGYLIKDMLKVGGTVGVAGQDPGDTAWNVSAVAHYYLGGLSNQYFSPFVGGEVGWADSGVEGEDGTLNLNVRFGGEAFPVSPLSVGGYVGFGWKQLDNNTDSFGTIRSAFFVTLYW